MRKDLFATLVGFLFLVITPVLAQATGGAVGTGAGAAGAGTAGAGGGLGNWWWLILVVIAVGAAFWYFSRNRRGL